MTDPDRDIRALLEDAVSDVEPRRGLDEIRPAPPPPRRRSWAWGAAGAVPRPRRFAAVTAVTGLPGGPGDDGCEPGPAVVDQATGPQTSATERPSQMVTVATTLAKTSGERCCIPRATPSWARPSGGAGRRAGAGRAAGRRPAL